MEKKTLHYLPHELIIQILLRLPVKSLIRFKCISKSWFSLISDTHFANSHFQNAFATHTHRVVFISTPALETRSIDFEASLGDDSASALLNLNFMHPQSYFNHEIRGSCRGFIFMHRSSDIYLWNPSTGSHKQIPLSPMDSDLGYEDLRFLYGFGYDKSTDDYLVVSLGYDISTTYLNIVPYFEFFSLRANTLDEIECIELVKYTLFRYSYTNDHDTDDPQVGTLFNGAIHWFAFHDNLSTDVIIAFDLMERKLLEMRLPDDFEHEPPQLDMWVFGEFLSLCTMGYDDDIVQIWVMKEYKMHSSWTKTHVLSIDGISTMFFSPLCSTKSCHIIGTDGRNGLVKYDDKGQLLEHHTYGNDSLGPHMAMYTESLLSLPDVNEQA
jgi:F-box interacting protein